MGEGQVMDKQRVGDPQGDRDKLHRQLERRQEAGNVEKVRDWHQRCRKEGGRKGEEWTEKGRSRGMDDPGAAKPWLQ